MIDRKTGKKLIMYKMHHPKSSIDRIHVTRRGGGRGLLQIEGTYKAEIINIAKYLHTNYAEDQFVNIVKSHAGNQPNMSSTIKTAAKVAEELNQSNGNSDTKKEGIQHIQARLGVMKEKNGKAK
jgi:hypothetical protein